MGCEALCLPGKGMEEKKGYLATVVRPRQKNLFTVWEERFAVWNKSYLKWKTTVTNSGNNASDFHKVIWLQNNESVISLEWLSMAFLCEYISNFNNTTVLQV